MSDIDYDELDTLIEINEFELERNCVDQPKLKWKFARLLADKRADLKGYEDQLLILNAELSRRMRINPGKYGLDKVTEAGIKAAIPEQERHQKQVRKINRCKHEADVLAAFVDSLEHRKRMLEKLVDLHGQNYFSTPVTKKKLRRRQDE